MVGGGDAGAWGRRGKEWWGKELLFQKGVCAVAPVVPCSYLPSSLWVSGKSVDGRRNLAEEFWSGRWVQKCVRVLINPTQYWLGLAQEDMIGCVGQLGLPVYIPWSDCYRPYSNEKSS